MKPIAYRLKNTNAGSDKFGACEVCNKFCSTVFLLTKVTRREKSSAARNILEKNGMSSSKFFYTQDAGLYGHKDCLVNST